jgi:glycosyltransferase involved in cell wall biosynthesis
MKLIIYSNMPVIPSNYGGAVRVHNIAEELAKKGIDVILVSPDLNKRPKKKDRIRYVFFTPTVSKLLKIKLISKFKLFLDFFVFFNEFFTLRKIISEESRNDTDIILQSEYLYSISPLYVLKKIYHFPLVITEHNVESDVYLQINSGNINKICYLILKSIEIFFLKQCDRIICVSETDKKMLIQKYSTDKKIIVAPNATNPVKITEYSCKLKVELKNQLNISLDTFIVLFVGTLDYSPNIHAVEIIRKEIYPKVKSKIQNVVFLIVGKGVEPRIEDDLIFTGLVDDVNPYIYISDVTVAPLTLGGGTRLKILEYMAFSKPVVSTSKGAEGLNVIHNENIIISDNWNDFSKEIVGLLLDSSKRSKIGNNGKKLIEENYTWESTANIYFDTYTQILEQ